MKYVVTGNVKRKGFRDVLTKELSKAQAEARFGLVKKKKQSVMDLGDITRGMPK